jgi:hypothetical protein
MIWEEEPRLLFGRPPYRFQLTISSHLVTRLVRRGILTREPPDNISEFLTCRLLTHPAVF